MKDTTRLTYIAENVIGISVVEDSSGVTIYLETPDNNLTGQGATALDALRNAIDVAMSSQTFGCAIKACPNTVTILGNVCEVCFDRIDKEFCEANEKTIP
jgi:hypothetical protein